MSLTALNWAKRWCAATGAPASERFVLWALADMADHSGRAWPRAATLAGVTGQSSSTVYRALDAWLSRGLIAVEERTRTDGRRASPSYRLQLRALPGPVDNPVDNPVDKSRPYSHSGTRNSHSENAYKEDPDLDPSKGIGSVGRSNRDPVDKRNPAAPDEQRGAPSAPESGHGSEAAPMSRREQLEALRRARAKAGVH